MKTRRKPSLCASHWPTVCTRRTRSTTRKIRSWLASRTSQDPDKTIQGAYHFTDTGLTADRDVVILLQWQDGVLKPIYPNDPTLIPSVARVQWPMPNW